MSMCSRPAQLDISEHVLRENWRYEQHFIERLAWAAIA
jgi:hypothetical protein